MTPPRAERTTVSEIITQPISGEVMDPLEDKAKRAADIICGHDFVNGVWPDDKADKFHRFVLEVLRTEWL